MTNRKKLPLIISIITLLSFITSAKAEVKVVTSIKPIHSLVSYVMDGVGAPDLIVDGFNSPHNFQLKPSHAKMLENADIIFWIGEGLENFLEKPLDSISKNAKKVELMEIKGINKLEFREKNIFNEHDHDEHKHEEDAIKKNMTNMNTRKMVIKKRNTMITTATMTMVMEITTLTYGLIHKMQK